jgi:hypothetical protein
VTAGSTSEGHRVEANFGGIPRAHHDHGAAKRLTEADLIVQQLGIAQPQGRVLIELPDGAGNDHSSLRLTFDGPGICDAPLRSVRCRHAF